jgi:long-chain acyl-CoA synthetase
LTNSLADNAALLDDRFRWHPTARIVLAHGQVTRASGGDQPAIPDQPAAAALAAAIARSAQGLPFRIGGGTEPPGPGPQPMFETLTSGTSGSPRRIWRSQASWTASFAVNAGMFGIGPGTNVAVLGQLIHSLALYGALEALHLGATLHPMADLRPDRQRQAMAATKIDILYATPAQAGQLADAKIPQLPHLRVILIGGSKLDATLRQRLADMAPNAALHEFYGAAETSFLTLATPDDPPASVGHAYPGVSLDIRDPAGHSLPPGATGEIWAQSPYLFHDYSADPGTVVWQNGWLSVGEIGSIINGLLYIYGRKNRIVQIADQSVYPEEIEAFMATLPGIDRVAIIPEPDTKRGAILMAFAIGTPEQEQAILASTRAKFGPLKSPRRIIWCDDWPVLASRKTDYQALQRGPK